MTLTGQCSKDFNDWYLRQDFSKQGQYEYGQRKALNMFNAMMLPFRWGVYVDFFESTGIDVDKIMMHHYKLMGGYSLKDNCRESAIEKSNQDYNAQ